MAHVCVEEWTAERSSFTMGTEQGKADLGTLAALIFDMHVAAARRNRVTGVLVRAVQSLKGCVAAGDHGASTAETRTRETLDKISEFCALFEELSQTVDEERMRDAGLLDA